MSQQHAHIVYFTLKDKSSAKRDGLLSACNTFLKEHAGVVFFATGTRDAGLVRDVNDKDFDVSLMIVFADRQAHDDYQQDARHHEFIATQKENWERVRVFDSNVA